jgi:hypothetical protein
VGHNPPKPLGQNAKAFPADKKFPFVSFHILLSRHSIIPLLNASVSCVHRLLSGRERQSAYLILLLLVVCSFVLQVMVQSVRFRLTKGLPYFGPVISMSLCRISTISAFDQMCRTSKMEIDHLRLSGTNDICGKCCWRSLSRWPFQRGATSLSGICLRLLAERGNEMASRYSISITPKGVCYTVQTFHFVCLLFSGTTLSPPST